MELTFVDIFAGAGGASIGLEMSGMKSVGAIEIDDWASDTYEFNHPSIKVIRSDISKLSDLNLKKFSGVDLVVGGPPCQGFSIAASNRRDANDPRNQLYLQYVRAIKIIRPEFFIVENVKEILKFKLKDQTLLINDFISKFEEIGYQISYGLLNAKDLGVPQDRTRFFMIGSLSKKMAKDFVETIPLKRKYPLLTLNDAISDLPVTTVGVDTKEYLEKPKNEYQKRIRGCCEQVYNHEPMRHTQRIIERFKHIPVNGNTQSVPAHHRNRQRGNVKELSKKIYHQNHRRLNPNIPCKTITASFYSSFIHPSQHRNITVREAARVQGFPDTFRFLGKRTTLSKKLLKRKGIVEELHLDQFNQVGNAVSPIVASEIGKSIIEL